VNGAARSSPDPPMHVLAWPAFENRAHNPYQALLYEQVCRLGVPVEEFSPLRLTFGRYSIWHLHWPDALFEHGKLEALLKTESVLRLMRLAEARGTKIVWTAHNLAAHERDHRWIEARFWPRFVRRLSGYIALTEAGRAAIQKRFPELEGTPGLIVPHGHYRAAYPTPPDAHSARRKLGIPREARMVLFFGKIRAYKQVPELVRAFARLDDRGAVLCVAGLPGSHGLATAIEREAAGDDRIRLVLDFVPPEETPAFFAAADLVALPYDEVLHSGTAMLALSFDRPVLIPASPTTHELQRNVGEEWIRTFSAGLSPPELEASLQWASEGRRAAEAPLGRFEWDSIGRQTIEAYEAILAAS
jgi:beta-1,4-mannosyltransferase